MNIITRLENWAHNANVDIERKKMGKKPLTQKQKDNLNKKRLIEAEREKEEKARKEKELQDKVNNFADKCGSFGWKVIKAQLSMIFTAAFFFVLWLLFYPV